MSLKSNTFKILMFSFYEEKTYYHTNYLVRQIRVNFKNNQLKTNKTSYKNF